MPQRLNTVTGINLGLGCKFVSEKDLHAQFKPFGFSLRSFRALTARLGVPYIVTPSGIRLYNLFVFLVAMTAISGLGKKNFQCPGYKVKDILANHSLPSDTNLETVCAEYLTAARALGHSPRRGVSTNIKAAAQILSVSLERSMSATIQKQPTPEIRSELRSECSNPFSYDPPSEIPPLPTYGTEPSINDDHHTVDLYDAEDSEEPDDE